MRQIVINIYDKMRQIVADVYNKMFGTVIFSM